MFAFTDKPQNVFELVSHGLTLFTISFKNVWYWSLMIAVFATVYPMYFMQLSQDVFMEITGSQRFAITLGWLVVAPLLVFLAGMLIRRIYVSGARTKEKIPKSALTVTKKVISLYLSMILIAFLTTIGFYMAFVPGLFVVVLFIFVVPLIVIDEMSIWKAFKSSCFLVWGNWWRIFLIVLLPLTLMSIATYITVKSPATISSFLQLLAMWLIIPLFYCMVLNGFSDAKLRHKMKPLKTKQTKATKK